MPRDTSSSIICSAHHHPGGVSGDDCATRADTWAVDQRCSSLFFSKDASNELEAWAFNWMIGRNDTSSINWSVNEEKNEDF